MRSIDEQMSRIMKRADSLREGERWKKHMISEAVISSVCLFLLVVTALFIPGLAAAQESSDVVRYGSLILSTPYLGYVVVGVLAFLLGVTSAFLCIHWKRWKSREKEISDR